MSENLKTQLLLSARSRVSTWILAALSVLLLSQCGKTTKISLTRSGSIDARIVSGVRRLGGQSAVGPEHPTVCEVASAHAKWMAHHLECSHHGDEKRKSTLFLKATENKKRFGEIVAAGDSPEKCAELWKNSPGHWKIMKDTWDTYCYTAEWGADGLLYCIGLFADGLPRAKAKIPPRQRSPQTVKSPRSTIGPPTEQPRGKAASSRSGLK